MDNALYESLSEQLGEEIAAAGQARIPIVTCTIEGESLTPEDIQEYCEQNGSLPAVKSDAKDLATLRAKHHQVARLLAAGLPEGLVADMTGYTGAYLSTLKNSPSMIELISHYRAPGDNAARVISEKLRLLADMSVEQLIAAAEAGELDANALLAAAKLGADRSGNGPMAKVAHEHTHLLDEDFVQRLAETSRKKNTARIIDITAVRNALPAPKQEGDDAA